MGGGADGADGGRHGDAANHGDYEGKASAVSVESPDWFRVTNVKHQKKYTGPEYNPIWSSRYTKHADAMLDAWWSLGDTLMLKHAQHADSGIGLGSPTQDGGSRSSVTPTGRHQWTLLTERAAPVMPKMAACWWRACGGAQRNLQRFKRVPARAVACA